MPQEDANPTGDTTPARGFDLADPTSIIPPGIPMARPIVLAEPGKSYDPILLMSETRGRAWADMGIVLLIIIALEVTIGSLIGAAAGVEGMDGDGIGQLESALLPEVLLPMLTVRATVVCLVIFAVARHRKQTRTSVGLRSTNAPLDTGLGIVTPPVVYGIGVFGILLLSSFRAGTLSEMQENAERLMEIIPPLPLWAYAALALLVGVYEELLFRGFLMPRLRRATGSWTLAVLVSTGLFTLVHAGDQTAPALIMVTALSLAFSVLTIWRRSIIPAVIAHTLFDLAQFLLMHYAFRGATP